MASLKRSSLFLHAARLVLITLLPVLLQMDLAVPASARAASPALAVVVDAGAVAGVTPTLHVDAAGTCTGSVPCYRTIQAAIDDVGPGQRIEIQPGTYTEQLRIRRKNAAAGASESSRIVIEAASGAAPGSVVLGGRTARCEGGYAIDIERSRWVTIRGLSIVNGGVRGIGLRGGSRENRGIRLESNRLGKGGPRECNGGIDVGRGNPETVIANNLIYANGKNGIRFRDGRGGSYFVVGNTIARNAWSGIQVSRAAVIELVNNVVAFNGLAAGASEGRVGVRRLRVRPAAPQDVRLLGNVVCGNRGGELAGAMLDAADAANVTPTGLEGSGVAASPGCDALAALFADAEGDDGALDTADDDFTLAAASAAVDAGVDPRILGHPVPDAVLESDFVSANRRPRDGDGDGLAAFDAGAIEGPGDLGPTATPTVTATPTDTPSPTPTLTAKPSPTVTPTVTPSPAVTITPPTPTVAPPTPTATEPPVVTPTATPSPMPTASPSPAVTATPTPSQTPRPGNRAPDARGNSYSVRADRTLSVPAPGILGNDDDPDGDPWMPSSRATRCSAASCSTPTDRSATRRTGSC